ncbi:MAG: hypothetical protein ACRDKS_10970 [Actinomycetota bacterium]
MRAHRAAAAAALVLVAALGAARSDPSYQTLAEQCRAIGGSERLCMSIEAFGSAVAHVCRYAGGPDDVCAFFKGKVISSALVDTYETTWVHKALTLQRALGSSLPLGEALFPATHNSFNSASYPPTLSGLDANQQYTMTDQLRMDMRGLEIDVHWFPSLTAEAGDGLRAPLMCHATGPHLGCTIERNLRDGLIELRAWLDAHPSEVVLLYIEDHLDDLTGHNRGAAIIEEVLGTTSESDIVFRPIVACEDGVPLAMSADDIVAAGKQVVIASACGIGAAWRDLVHSQDDFWVEGGSDDFDANPPCGFTAEEYANFWTRSFEDSTWLTTMVNGSAAPMTAAHFSAMVACGVNMPSFDQLSPEDPRIASLVWSWAPDEPSTDAVGACALLRSDGRFAVDDCGASHRAACVAADGTWTISQDPVSWAGASAACPAGTTFAVPGNALQNLALNAVKATAGVADAWLAYAATGSGWSS